MTLNDVARWGSGGTPKSRDPRYYSGGTIPWAVIGDLTDGPVETTASLITRAAIEESSAKLIPSGAVLVAMYGSIGKLGTTAREMATNQAIAFAVPDQHVIDGRFLFWYLRSQRAVLLDAGKGAAQQNISQTLLKGWPVPVPPLDEQRRIVAILEDHLSRIDAASGYLDAVVRRRKSFVKAFLIDLIPETMPADWVATTVAGAGSVDLGRQRHPDWHSGPEMRPYLRVANVFEDRIDTRSVYEMDFTGVFERYKLAPGDVLLNEGQSPEYLGRPAIYRGNPPDVAFTNTLLRFRANPDVLPEWALLVFRRHMHSGRFSQESRITTNIAHLSSSRFKSVEFPIPPMATQERLITAADTFFLNLDRVYHETTLAQQRSKRLRGAILSAAFAGDL